MFLFMQHSYLKRIYRKEDNMIKLVLVRHGQSIWNLENRFTGWTDVGLSEQGVKEAIDAGKVLKEKGFKIPKEAIEKGLRTVVHKARFEVLSKSPKIIFDGGHNENAINNLKNTINQYYPSKKKVYILSTLKTKDYRTVIKILTQDKNGIFFFTTGNDPNRYVSKEDLYNEAKKYLSKDIYKEELEDAIKIAKEKYKDDVIMIIRKLLCI